MSDAEHHHDGPPVLPTIVDEAGDTPTWVPILGVALFALVAIVFVARSQMATEVPATPEAAEAPTAPAATP